MKTTKLGLRCRERQKERVLFFVQRGKKGQKNIIRVFIYLLNRRKTLYPYVVTRTVILRWYFAGLGQLVKESIQPGRVQWIDQRLYFQISSLIYSSTIIILGFWSDFELNYQIDLGFITRP